MGSQDAENEQVLALVRQRLVRPLVITPESKFASSPECRQHLCDPQKLGYALGRILTVNLFEKG
jgi:hypothetical protein